MYVCQVYEVGFEEAKKVINYVIELLQICGNWYVHNQYSIRCFY